MLPAVVDQPVIADHANGHEFLQGYCIVGDIRPRHQTLSAQTRSVHMFHSIAVLDRVNLFGLSDQLPGAPVAIDPNVLLPQKVDMECVLSRCTTIMSR